MTYSTDAATIIAGAGKIVLPDVHASCIPITLILLVGRPSPDAKEMSLCFYCDFRNEQSTNECSIIIVTLLSRNNHKQLVGFLTRRVLKSADLVQPIYQRIMTDTKAQAIQRTSVRLISVSDAAINQF